MDEAKEAGHVARPASFVYIEVEIITYSPPLPAWSQVR